MPSEAQTPVAARVLRVQGLVSSSTLRLVRKGLPGRWPSSARCVFVSYAYADLPVGERFDAVAESDKLEGALATTARILAVTQQFGVALDVVPQGWKTICVVDFPAGVPACVAQLPVLDAWDRIGRVFLATRETLAALQGDLTAAEARAPDR